MARRKPEELQIKIPERMINEVDKMVIETGLYSDKAEFVADACRRLILESKKEVKVRFNRKDVNAQYWSEIESVGSKRALNSPDLKGDI